MTAYRTIHRDHHHHGWDNSLAPALRIDPDTDVELATLEASGGQLDRNAGPGEVAGLDFARVNPVTGPIFVEGAEPGDGLEVELLEFAGSGWGWTALIPGFGLLAEDFTDPFIHISSYDTHRVEFTPEIRLPTRPFPGTIGLAPAEAGLHSVVPPRSVGGNLDIRDLVQGARLHLPVAVPGALLSVGDAHAAQGDGEVCGTAIETSMTVRIRVRLTKGANLRRPQFELPAGAVTPSAGGYYVTTGIAPDLMLAAKDAIRDMIDHLGRSYRLEPELAYALCSVAVDLRISEVVDAPNWVVSAYLSLGIFG